MSGGYDQMNDAPFKFGDVVTITYEAVEMPGIKIGTIREFGTYPAPWVRLVGTPSDGSFVVFLGPGVFMRLEKAAGESR